LNTFPETRETRRRSGGAQKKKFRRFSTQIGEKHGLTNDGVSHRSPEDGEQRGSRGVKETIEWSWDRMWDWNFSPGVPAAIAVRPRSAPRAPADLTTAPAEPGASGVVGVWAGGAVAWAAGGRVPHAAGSPGLSRELLLILKNIELIRQI
jgi:hypothetical protein